MSTDERAPGGAGPTLNGGGRGWPAAAPTAPPDAQAPTTVHELGVELADLARSLSGPLQRLSVRSGDCEVAVEWVTASSPATAPAPLMVSVVPTTAAEPVDAPDEGMVVLAPLVGTYFAAPAPDAEPFVKVGDPVVVGQTVAIVEAMKMMNEVVAAEAGTVAEILVTDGQPVQFEQSLLRLVAEESP